MKNSIIILLVAILSLAVSFIGTRIFLTNTDQNQDLLAKVLDRGEIRAGYIVYPPSFIKDPATGKMSGITYDAIEKAGRNLELKINWVEETGWGTMIEGLNTERYDIVVSGIWPNSVRGKNADFTIPLYYSAVGIYTRTNDDRFYELSKINNKDVTIATIDGEMSSFITKATFPKAKTLSLTQDAQISQLLLNIKTGKADVTFVETAIAQEFLANNPDSIKNIVPNNPIRSFGNSILVPKNQEGFKSMMNTALEELFNSGYIDELLKKYEKYPDSLYPVAKPYATPI